MSRRTNLKNWLVIIALLLAAQYSLTPQARAGSVVSWWNMAVDSNDFPGRNFVTVAAGAYHSLAIEADGSIVGWGHNRDGQATAPSGNDFVAISAGRYHSLALKTDGSITGWGLNDDGQATPPPGNDFVAISAGGNHSLALKADGSIVGWGRNNFGEATPPSGNDFVAVSARRYHNLAIRQVAPPPIEAEIKLAPDTLNLQSKGRWLTCHILLPQDCNAADIESNSVLLEEEIPADKLLLEGKGAMVKFSRSALQQILADLDTPAEAELLVTGQLTDGTIFEGTDTITVIDKGGKQN
jgi:hypothetical protein